jgi:hypothetical protein
MINTCVFSVQKYLISNGAESTCAGTTWAESTWGRKDLKRNLNCSIGRMSCFFFCYVLVI